MKVDTNSLNLRDLTKDSFYAVCLLSVKPEQVNHVDSNAISIAEASFSESAWFKGIYLNDIAVGFVMVDVKPNENKYYLWRFMIDAKYQGFGLGKRSIELLLIELKNPHQNIVDEDYLLTAGFNSFNLRHEIQIPQAKIRKEKCNMTWLVMKPGSCQHRGFNRLLIFVL